MIAGRDQTYIRKVRVKSDARDALSLRLHLPAALAAANLHPPGLPRSAIAFINKLRDPLPGAMRIEGGRVDPTPAWQRAVAESLDQLVRRAARPAREAVPAGAEAVVFLDRSELLASLAIDFLEGEILSRWWWRSLIGGNDLSIAVFREWLDAIEYVPPAFLLLAQKRVAARFAAKLGEEGASRLLVQVVHHFGLTELASLISYGTDQSQHAVTRNLHHSDAEKTQRDEELMHHESSELETRWAPEAFDPALKHSQRVLLGISLALERAPTVLRAPQFAGRFLQSLSDESMLAIAVTNEAEEPQRLPAALAHAGSLVSTGETVSKSQSAGESVSEVGSGLHRPGYEEPRGDPLRETPGREVIIDSADLPRTPLQLQVGIHAESTEGPCAQEPRALQLESAEHQPEPLTIYDSPSQSNGLTEALPVTTAPIEMTFDTEFGGVFYLINAALALNLYGDFTKPREPGIDLSIWHFLLLMGRELASDRIEADAVWGGLLFLSGQSRASEPGDGFDPPVEWRMSPEWLDAFPENGPWGYSVSQARLRVWHPAGFAVLDLPFKGERAGSVKAMLASEMASYPGVSGFESRRSSSDLDSLESRRGGLERWTQWISGYLRVRLARALGLERADEFDRLLLGRRARAEVTPARLDIFFSLADLAVEVRLSGLDRDPGWVPAAGRTITFHYE